MGFPGDSAGKESACNARDLGSIPGLGRFPWRREQQPTPVFWPGEFHGLCSLWGHKESDTTERLSLSLVYEYIFASPKEELLDKGRIHTHTGTYQKLSHPYHDLFNRWWDQKRHVWAGLGLRRLLTGLHHDQSFGQRTGFASRLAEIQTKEVGVRLSSLLRSVSLHTMQADITVSVTLSFFISLSAWVVCNQLVWTWDHNVLPTTEAMPFVAFLPWKWKPLANLFFCWVSHVIN